MASDQQTLTAEDERDLVLCGFVAFEDPPDASAAEVVAAAASEWRGHQDPDRRRRARDANSLRSGGL